MSNVMVVEDEQVVAEDIAQSLTSLGHNVTALAASVDECLRNAEIHPPDLVLMDIHLAGQGDGVQAAEQLRKRFDVPVIFLTAYSDDNTLKRAKHTTPLGYLLKPFRQSELKSAVEIGLFRHQLERELKERERWFSTTLGALAESVVAVDAQERVAFLNRSAETLLGVRAEDAAGAPFTSLIRLVRGPDGTPVDNPVRRALRERKVAHLDEDVMLCVPGREVPIEDSVAPIEDEEGNLFGAVMVFQDVTEKRGARAQAAQADRMAALGTLAAGVGHEINNPLTYVLGNAAYAKQQLIVLKQRALQGSGRAWQPTDSVSAYEGLLDAVGEIQEGAERVAEIVRDIRGFSLKDPTAVDADLNASVRWATRIAGALIRARANLTIQLGDVPRVVGDGTRLGQVVLNLLINAAQAMDENTVHENELFVSTTYDRPGCVVATVRDNGCGIEPTTLQRIFEPFFTTKPQGVGTGLGLFVCHGIIRELGGRMSVDTEPGVGTTFRVWLRAVPAVGTDDTTAGIAAPVTRARVLLVDDDRLVLNALANVLKPYHDVVKADTATYALEILERDNSFDVVFCDLSMPEMSGMDLYERLLTEDPGTARKVVFFTGGQHSPGTRAFLDSVHNEVIYKPSSAEELLATVARNVTKAS